MYADKFSQFSNMIMVTIIYLPLSTMLLVAFLMSENNPMQDLSLLSFFLITLKCKRRSIAVFPLLLIEQI